MSLRPGVNLVRALAGLAALSPLAFWWPPVLAAMIVAATGLGVAAVVDARRDAAVVVVAANAVVSLVAVPSPTFFISSSSCPRLTWACTKCGSSTSAMDMAHS